jgi:TonB family protein
VLLAPKLPPVRLSQSSAAGTNTMELLVDEFGRVEQVQLVSPPVRLGDMTLLSAAKTWRFHPALKDGQPVRYRLSVSWTVSPP